MNKKIVAMMTTFFVSSWLSAEELPKEYLIELRQPWKKIQMQAHNSVVQIFAQHAQIDILYPWLPPAQMPVRGTGFFINEEGYLLTNAHVVDQALVIWIKIPSLGKRFITVELVGICPESDIALLRIPSADLPSILEQVGKIVPLPLGDSDTVCRTDEVLALGYPLGQESLKSTAGVISGQEGQWIQMDAAINPGSSGGPLVDIYGRVIGINSRGITEAQNVGYIIPINNIKVILEELYKKRFVCKPFLGVLTINATDDVTDYLGNPQPGGCYVVEVIKGSPLEKAGVQTGDMIYEMNGNRLDIFGEMNVPWYEDKVSIMNYIARIELGQEVPIVIYRKGERIETSISFEQSERLPVRRVYPGYEKIDYEIFAGMVVMELTLNHVQALAQQVPGLATFGEMKNQNRPVLVITHIFSNSSLFKARTLQPGATLVEINHREVHTLKDFREAIKEGADETYFVIRASDRISNVSDNLLVVLPYEKILKEELSLSAQFQYTISDTVKELLKWKGLKS